jgi:N-acyl-D-aspartate/D-glutamate deacylase
MNLRVDCPYSSRRSFRCHYDAQVTWDPPRTFSGCHSATSVIIGNRSLALGPVRRGNGERLAEFLSYAEAIPMEVPRTINVTWEIPGESMGTLDKRLVVGVGPA